MSPCTQEKLADEGTLCFKISLATSVSAELRSGVARVFVASYLNFWRILSVLTRTGVRSRDVIALVAVREVARAVIAVSAESTTDVGTSCGAVLDKGPTRPPILAASFCNCCIDCPNNGTRRCPDGALRRLIGFSHPPEAGL